MSARRFLLWNVVGAVLWVDGVLLAGYLLARQIYDAIGDQIDRYILPVVALIVLISVTPILIELIRERKAKKKGPGPATAVSVVAAATVAGTADAIDGDEEPRRRGRHAAP
jgi:membrane-associated protein